MIVAAVIPARYHSSRFPGKPLTQILGKPMIQHVYESVRDSALFSDVIVATDHETIFDCVRSFSGNVVYTRSDHQSGTDWVWEAVSALAVDAVINVQGDEPLVDHNVLKSLCAELMEKKEKIVTAAFRCTDLDWYRSDDHVKVVFDPHHHALYFSRSPIPHQRPDASVVFWHHVGIYGYLKDVLKEITRHHKSDLEQCESLEQLRFLEMGYRIKVVETEYEGMGVDRPEDVLRVEERMKRKKS